MKRPTQSDVARLAGVSRATVSYVINGLADQGKQSIPEETRSRVEEAVRTLGYTPNMIARGLGSGRSNAIGLLIPNTYNPHYLDIIQGVEDVVMQHQYALLLNSIRNDNERERVGIEMLAQQQVDGLILIPTYADNTDYIIEQMSTRKLPIVALGADIIGVDSVHINWISGMEALVTHILELGHQNIVYIHAPSNAVVGQIRLDVYNRVLRDAGFAVTDDYIIRCEPTVESVYHNTKLLLNGDHRPTVILASNDIQAMGIIRACAECGLRIPHDISVTGFDNISLSNYLPVTLTTVDSQSQKLGNLATELLFNRLDNPNLIRQERQVDTQLIIRESTGPVPN
jgi:LacI family transcriptional regulator